MDVINHPELVLVSMFEHFSYCPRQCALIHMEDIFDENIYTLRGRLLHERADEGTTEFRDGIRIERGLPIWCDRLGLVGKADVVEFHGSRPYPVEYKHGQKRRWGHDDLQVCAQAICLEEMTGLAVPRGAIYHHGSRRRREVIFDEALRRRVEETTLSIRAMMRSDELPPPPNDARCRHCSLIESCMPSITGDKKLLRTHRRLLFSVCHFSP